MDFESAHKFLMRVNYYLCRAKLTSPDRPGDLPPPHEIAACTTDWSCILVSTPKFVHSFFVFRYMIFFLFRHYCDPC
jgi:hypothetical protein